MASTTPRSHNDLYLHPLQDSQLPELITIARQTYWETFVGMGYYTEAIVNGYLDTSFAPAKMAKEQADPQHYFYFLSSSADPADDAARVGYLKLVPGKALPLSEPLADPVYLERLYILASAQGKGYGRSSLALAKQEALAMGGGNFWLTVWEHNTPAIGFYEKTGWRRVGTTDFAFDSEGKHYVDTDLLYTKPIV